MRSVLALLVLLAACHRPPHPGTPPLHVLLVTVEQLRADRLSCYQHLVPTSALESTLEERIEGRAFGLDELARGGVLFEQAFAPSSALGPSLAALHTGRSPIETGVLGAEGVLEERFTTLASELARRGFATGACVTGTGDRIARVAAAGFESFRERDDDERTLAAARKFFERDVGDGRSTFLWIHLAGPALPWDAPLAPADGRRFVDPSYAGAADGSTAFLARVARGELALDAADRAALGARYDERLCATLERLASFLRDVYDWNTSAVEASETWARTLFVFAGTNGCTLGEHGVLGAALSPHEEALRVPLLLRHPDTLTGERVFARCVTLEDVAPTVLDAFGFDAPAETDGRSLWTLLDERSSGEFDDRPAIAVLPGPRYSLRAEGLRAVWDRWSAAPDAFLLYDRRRDPLERVDRAAEAPRAAEWARAAILAWRARRTAWRDESKVAH